MGQSLCDDLRWARRFRQVRRLPVPWRSPTPQERRSICAHPTFGRFADDAVALADWGERRWIVMERTWSGWPDPPTYALFVLEGEAIWLARDFDGWPSAWREPWFDGAEGEERRRMIEERRAARSRPLREALLLLAGAPLALAGWWVGVVFASGSGQGLDRTWLPEAGSMLFFGAVFALAAALRLFGRPARARWRRSAALWRGRARRRWGRGRERGEFARVYRSALWSGGLATAVLAAAILAGIGIDGLDQSLALIMALATASFAGLALQVFAWAGFRAVLCLPLCLAAGILASILGPR
ncbi:hypothetical protein [Antarcticirhabdus aurantiaca]|uniref:Uncharacterized protein n=1 Tax=Antarcticirhabdus aurantiaca TaxID=2606717 RepID=A0ACD4NNI1_9HYPH|nr:hypothetical protein [Antarcticirhabdus aurantiaca]WAJ28279.1 hypothetical protein OXU80_26260 [Jeongeuplla avenae]